MLSFFSDTTSLSEVDLFEHLRVIYRRRWTILLVSLGVAGGVFGWSSTRVPVYGADAVISVTSGRALAGQNVNEEDTLFLTRNYAELATTPPVLADAALRSRLAISAREARRRVSSRAASDVGFLTITARGPSPAAATALAKGAAESLVAAVDDQQRETVRIAVEPIQEEIGQLDAQLVALPDGASNRGPLEARYEALVRAATERRLAPSDRLTLVSPARGDLTPLSPKPVRDALLALLVALVVNAELLVVVEVLRDRFSVHEPDEGPDELLGLAVLARVPSGETEESLEAFRALRTNLMFLETETPLRTVAIVSTNPGAGKTFTSVHLARSVASLEIPTVLVDGDLRRPSVHRQLGMSESPGLGDLLAGADIGRVLRNAPDDPHLKVLTGGSSLADPVGMMAARRFREVLAQLHDAGVVVIDTPACDLFADGLAIASQCDATLMVVDSRGTRRRSVRRVIHQLRRMGANPIGIVINRVETQSRGSYYYRYDRRPQPVRR